jgi:HSP20 family molecular chaperone IbpA
MNERFNPVGQRINLFPQPRPFWVPNADIFIAPSGDLIVCLELSAMRSSGIELTADRNQLRITGERPNSGVADAKSVLVHEINAGPFETVIAIPPGFDLPHASAAYMNGTLRITVPALPNPS